MVKSISPAIQVALACIAIVLIVILAMGGIATGERTGAESVQVINTPSHPKPETLDENRKPIILGE